MEHLPGAGSMLSAGMQRLITEMAFVCKQLRICGGGAKALHKLLWWESNINSLREAHSKDSKGQRSTLLQPFGRRTGYTWRPKKI